MTGNPGLHILKAAVSDNHIPTAGSIPLPIGRKTFHGIKIDINLFMRLIIGYQRVSESTVFNQHIAAWVAFYPVWVFTVYKIQVADFYIVTAAKNKGAAAAPRQIATQVDGKVAEQVVSPPAVTRRREEVRIAFFPVDKQPVIFFSSGIR